MNQPARKTAIIAGGSLGGLFTGIVLQSLGYAVKICERAPSMADQGAGIVCQPDTQAFFAKYDRTKTPLVVPAYSRQYLDRDGKVIHKEDKRQLMTSWDKLFHVLRANFDGQLHEAVTGNGSVAEATKNCSYLLGHTINSFHYDPTSQTVKIKYTSQEENTPPEKRQEGQDNFPSSRSEKEEKEDSADLLVCADGSSSTLRRQLLPEVKRSYAGYVAFRGLCCESDVDSGTREALNGFFTFYHGMHMQILSYLIPGPNGTLEEGKRNLNWVWYVNFAEGSSEINQVLSDKAGKRHPYSVPSGDLPKSTLDLIHKLAQDLPPPMRALVLSSSAPFVQAITDTLADQAVFSDGHVLMLGEALAGPRPHTAASASQAARQVLHLERALQQDNLAEWEKNVLEFAANLDASGRKMGNTSQFGHHPYASD